MIMNISKAALISAEYSKILKTLEWEESCFEDENQLNNEERVDSGIVGSAVDYLSRMMITGDKSKAFEISMLFKKIPFFANHTDSWVCNHADTLLEKITGLDDLSIIRACNLVCFDLIIRTSYADFLKGYNQCANLPPEDYKSTVENIRVMVQRCIEYFKGCAPVTETGFCVRYESLKGDGDFVTETALVDLKTSKRKTSQKDKRQLFLYWYAGLHTEGLDFSKIDTLSIFNPRLNMAWKLKTSQFTEELLEDADMFCLELS